MRPFAVRQKLRPGALLEDRARPAPTSRRGDEPVQSSDQPRHRSDPKQERSRDAGDLLLFVAVLRAVTARREGPPRPLLRLLLAWCRRALIELDHAQDLNALAALADLAVDRRALRRVLQSGLFQCGD